MVITQSFRRRVPDEWIAHKIKHKGNIHEGIETFPLVDDHHIIIFKSKTDQEAVLASGPWMVAKQLLAMEH